MGRPLGRLIREGRNNKKQLFKKVNSLNELLDSLLDSRWLMIKLSAKEKEELTLKTKVLKRYIEKLLYRIHNEK